MPKYCQLVIGPAGSGKSTFCSTMVQHLEASKRPCHVLNLDPAAEAFDYPVHWNIKDVISVDDVAEALHFGPNGGLVYCMEFLLSNIEVFDEALGDYEDDYIILDCPGQIELYTHIPVMRQLVQHMQQQNFRICAIYLLDSQFMDDPSKFFSGILSATSTMLQLEVPHINVMSKMDLVETKKREMIEQYLNPDPQFLLGLLNKRTTAKQHQLNQAMASLIEDFSLVSFVPLNKDDEESIEEVLLHVDRCLQYGEDEEVHEAPELDEQDEANM